VSSGSGGGRLGWRTRPQKRVDRAALSVAALGDDTDRRAYWHARTPEERLAHVETLRRLNYGTKATARLQRVLEVAGPQSEKGVE